MTQFKPRAPRPVQVSPSLRLRELAVAVTSLNVELKRVEERMLTAEARVKELEAENERLKSEVT